ncbi:hemerythrin domain-containing protein [Paraburkholderia sp. SOS3]|uniref:hemerythrin domain-containing protein n=1 Tax=Paraburkholderia sp. SOS3 TaxID=1926494 RepID=UPI0009F96D95|nr:hemerythrin domain-containing protein [Paraburkholderia sp. SOS3]
MSRETTPEGPYADTRTMLDVHAMFRREFRRAPALVDGVLPDDRPRTDVVAGHIHFLCAILHAHHTLEDEFLWPRLKDRGSAETAEISLLMENHHSDIATIVARINDELQSWRSGAGSQHRSALSQAIRQLIPALLDHMSLEESRAFPAIEQHVTAAEWERMHEAARSHFSQDDLLLAKGMITCAKLESAPEASVSPFEQQALQMYVPYAERVHGPARTSE